jgi:hypothetical protein
MIIEVGVLSVVLAATCQRMGVGEHTLSEDNCGATLITVSGSAESNLLFSESMEEAVAADLSTVSNVNMVMVERADDNLLVWIALDNPTKEVREKVFRKQFDIIDGFPEISFDFNLISAKNRSPEEFASSAKLIYSREVR